MMRMMMECEEALIGAPLTGPRELPDIVASKVLPLRDAIFNEADLAKVRSSADRSIAYLHEGFKIMYGEFGEAMSLVNSSQLIDDRGQFALRNLIRTADACFQGTTSFFGNYLRAAAARGEISLDEDEEELIGGKASPDKFLDTINLWSLKVGDGGTVAKKGKGWVDFKKLALIRDRLHHPRSTNDLQMDLKTLDTAMSALGILLEAIGCMALDKDKLPAG
jgi:hypothetical protein